MRTSKIENMVVQFILFAFVALGFECAAAVDIFPKWLQFSLFLLSVVAFGCFVRVFIRLGRALKSEPLYFDHPKHERS